MGEMNHENSSLPRDAKTVLRALTTPGDTRWSGMRRAGLGTFRPIPELVKRAIKLSTATSEAATTALLAGEAAEKEAAANLHVLPCYINSTWNTERGATQTPDS